MDTDFSYKNMKENKHSIYRSFQYTVNTLSNLINQQRQSKNYNIELDYILKEILDEHVKQYTYLQNAIKELQEIEQTCGKALKYYPWYKDDIVNFPHATEEDGVCVGDHTPLSIVEELITQYKNLKK